MSYARLVGAVLAVVVSLVVPVSPARAQNDYVDTPGVPEGMPGADRVPALIDAYNDGSVEAIGAVMREHFIGPMATAPMHEHADVWNDEKSRTGPLKLVGFRTYDPPRETLVPILQSEVTGAYHALVIEMEQDEPHRFTFLTFVTARTPSFVTPAPPLEGAALWAEVDALVDRMVEHEMFSGTVAVSKDGEVVYARAAGLASRRFDVPNRLDTKFNLGSMNKMFTAVAIAALQEQGKLSYDDLVGAHLPEFPNAEIRERVQIRHLLSHTSGMGSHFTEEFMNSSKARYRSIDNYIGLFAENELAFEPGTQWAYSNAGFYVLGQIIEAASGMSYYDCIRAHVYEPAGMVNSDSYDMDIPVKNLAIGYSPGGRGLNADDDGRRFLDARGWMSNTYRHSIKGGPGGGGFSTSPDLLAFADALANGRLVSSSSLATLTTPKPEIGSERYGYGFEITRYPVLGRRFGHSGGFPGINAHLRLFPDTGYAVAAMANMDGAASTLALQIERILEGL